MYNLINYYNAPGEKTLTNIFSEVVDYGLIGSYRKFSGNFNATETITEDTVTEDYVTAFLIPTSTVGGGTAQYIWTSSTNKFTPTLMRKVTSPKAIKYMKEANEEAASMGEPRPYNLNKTNFKGELYVPADSEYLSAQNGSPDFKVEDKFKSVNITIDRSQYNVGILHRNGRIKKISYRNDSMQEYAEIKFDDLSNRIKLIPSFELDDKGNIVESLKIDLGHIQSIIESDINKC